MRASRVTTCARWTSREHWTIAVSVAIEEIDALTRVADDHRSLIPRNIEEGCRLSVTCVRHARLW